MVRAFQQMLDARFFVQNNGLYSYNQFWQNKVAVPLSNAKGHGEIKCLGGWQNKVAVPFSMLS
jgi:hypothetical protein